MSQLTQTFFEKILAAEGGYQNQSADSGNVNRCGVNAGTKYGITPNAWQEYSGQQCPSPETMKNITQTQAWAFMDWWGSRWRIWEIYDQDFAELVFNAFYGNPSAAAKTLQLTLNQRGYTLAPDGIMGSKTPRRQCGSRQRQSRALQRLSCSFGFSTCNRSATLPTLPVGPTG